MSKVQVIEDSILDKILKEHADDNICWNRNQIIIDGVFYYRKSKISTEVSNKVTAQSLIKKEPVFDFSFMDEVYSILDENNMDHIRYALANHCRGVNHERDCEYMIDLYSAYPHVFHYERMPVDGKLYYEECADKLNFYRVDTGCMKSLMVTDDLKNYLVSQGETVTFLFGTDYIVGTKMSQKLIDMCYKNEKTKQEAKIQWGYYQKKFLQYMPEEDCYARNATYNKELLMVAMISQLTYVLFSIRDIIGSMSGRFVTDAYFFTSLDDMDRINDEIKKAFPNYDYRIYNTFEQSDEDRHGKILYKSYKDLPKAPRSHHKKA